MLSDILSSVFASKVLFLTLQLTICLILPYFVTYSSGIFSRLGSIMFSLMVCSIVYCALPDQINLGWIDDILVIFIFGWVGYVISNISPSEKNTMDLNLINITDEK